MRSNDGRKQTESCWCLQAMRHSRHKRRTAAVSPASKTGSSVPAALLVTSVPATDPHGSQGLDRRIVEIGGLHDIECTGKESWRPLFGERHGLLGRE